METKLLNIKGQETGKAELPDFIFAQKADVHFLHEAVKYYLANKRVGTASTKTRSEVSGGGKKPWKQKGTGRARAGSNRSPVWRKGGVVFGPRPRDFSIDMPKTKRHSALIQALSAKAADGAVLVVENFNFESAKTKNVAALVKSLNAGSKTVLAVYKKSDKKAMSASRNLSSINFTAVSDLNAYEILRSGFLLISKEAVEILKKTLEAK